MRTTALAPTGTMPLKLGVVSLVRASLLLVPLSLAGSRPMVLKPVLRSPPPLVSPPLLPPLVPALVLSVSVAVLPAASRALAVRVPVGTGLTGARLQVPLVPTVVLPMMLLSTSRTVTTAPISPVPLMALVVPPVPGAVMFTLVCVSMVKGAGVSVLGTPPTGVVVTWLV